MSSGSKTPKALVIGVWGDPSRWDEVEYRIHIPSISNGGVKHLAQKRYGSAEWSILTRSSTLALTCFFKGFAETRTIIIGLDSLADLSDPSCRDVGVRRCAENRYKGFVREFVAKIDKSVCDLSIYENFTDLIMVPARGSFRGYTFGGSPVHIFNRVFIKVLRAVDEFKPSFVVLDVTHGVNYQTIASHYAVLGVVKLVNALRRVRREKEANLIIMNSEPIPPTQQRREVKQVEIARTPGTPQLSILDVSEIENALDFINDLTSAISFRLPLSEPLLTENGSESNVLQRLAKFVFLVESGAAGLTFPGAVDEAGTPLAMDICSVQVDAPEPDVEYQPQLKDNVAVYPDVSTQPILLYSLHKAVIGLQQKLCGTEVRADLVKYLNSVGEVLKDAKLPHLHYIATKEGAKLGLVQAALKKLASECWQLFEDAARGKGIERISDLINVKDSEVEVSRALFASLRNVESDSISKCCTELVSKILGDRVQIGQEKQEKSCSVSDEMVRNMVAHAGLSYNFMEKVVFSRDSYRITKVVYRRCLVEDFIESLQKMLKE